MIVQYNGIGYNGFQKQKTGNTIQGEIESAIKQITNRDVTCVASGRTDAKVSAYAQPVHFDIDYELYAPDFLGSLNAVLPADIKVLSIKPTTLHARFSAKKKTYIYKMYISQTALPLHNDALQIKPLIRFTEQKRYNFKTMKMFCKLIKGEHDFKGFQASGSPTETTIRTIYSAKLIQNGADLYFQVTGNGFLYKMVRNLVGTMLALGEGKLDFKTLKTTAFTTYKCKHTAPPEYLYLQQVKYN